MEYRSVKGFTGWAQTGFFLAFTGLGFVLAGALSVVFLMQVAGSGFDDLSDDSIKALLFDPKNATAAKWLQIGSSFFLLCLPAILWCVVVWGRKTIWLGFTRHISAMQLLLGFLIMMAAGITASYTHEISRSVIAGYPDLYATAQAMELEYARQALALSVLNGWQDFAVSLIIIALLPALFEELFFRGVLQNYLTKWWRSPWVAIIVTSVIFSLVHASVFLFVSRIILGVALGIMFYHTKSLWPGLVAHFINNALVLSTLFFSETKPTVQSMLEPEMSVNPIFAAVSVLAIIGLAVFLKKYSAANRARIVAREQALYASADPFGQIAHES